MIKISDTKLNYRRITMTDGTTYKYRNVSMKITKNNHCVKVGANDGILYAVNTSNGFCYNLIN